MIATLLAQQVGLATPAVVVFAVVGVVLVFGMQLLSATRGIATAVASYKPKFPAPPPVEEPR